MTNTSFHLQQIHEIKSEWRAIEIQDAAVIKAQLNMCFHVMCKSSFQINIIHYETQIINIICTLVEKLNA